MKDQKGHPSIVTFVGWCELMEIKPCRIESILEYARVCRMMAK